MPDDQTTADELRDRVDELERQIAELQRSGDVGRRRVLAALAGAAGLGAAGVHLGSAPASAQAAGQVGTTSDPVDVFGYNVQAENGVETPSLTDADTGTTYDIGTFTEGEVLSDEDGDGVYTLPSGSVGIDVSEVSANELDTGSVNTEEQSVSNVAASATIGSAQTVSSGTISEVAFDTTHFEQTKAVSSELQNNALVVEKGGTYRISAQVRFKGSENWSNGDRCLVRTRINGGKGKTKQLLHAGVNERIGVRTTGEYELSQGDTITVEILHTSVSDETLGAGEDKTFVEVVMDG